MQIDDIGKILYTILIYGFIALFIGISQAAGIGGGPILNICLMLGLGYETKSSMAITYVFLIGGSVASICCNYGIRNKAGTKNLIDYNLVIITLPMTVSGSIFGALFNHFISEFIITITFTGLLSYLAYNSYRKYIESASSIRLSLTSLKMGIEMDQISPPLKNSKKLKSLLEEELNPFPKQKIVIFLQIIGYTIVTLLFKGGNSFQSIIGLAQCGTGTWICVLIHLGISYLVAKFIAQKKQKLDSEMEAMGYIFENENDRMTKSFSHKAMILGFAGGFTGGMLGIGGAVILVPVWIQMGIDKNIASSSSAPLILSSAFISMIIAFLCQYYNSFTMILFYFVLSFLSSYYIKLAINQIKRKYEMEGMLFLLLIIIMVMSLIFLLPYSMQKMISEPEQFFNFGHMC